MSGIRNGPSELAVRTPCHRAGIPQPRQFASLGHNALTVCVPATYSWEAAEECQASGGGFSSAATIYLQRSADMPKRFTSSVPSASSALLYTVQRNSRPLEREQGTAGHLEKPPSTARQRWS
jgi:hypothetical protein